jgi:hypothetical protein
MKPPRIEEVRILPDKVLTIRWSTGETLTCDLADWIADTPVLAPLADDAVFATAHPGLWGHSVTWDAPVDLGADNLYELCKRQAGLPSPQHFDAWMHRNNLSLSTAATALGLSRRMVAHYRTGSRPIPKVVGLACVGWEVEHRQADSAAK